MRFRRILSHLLTTRYAVRRRFTPQVLAAIERTIRDIESRHEGEIRFVVEGALDLPELWHEVTARQRAVRVFSQLGVWDTALNNGVLVHVLLADRDVEILADRGVAERVPQSEWEAVCHEMEVHYRAGRFGEGSIVGITRVGEMLQRHFPGRRTGASELPDQPILL